jgi:cyclic pyranopterin phosphate synthase
MRQHASEPDGDLPGGGPRGTAPVTVGTSLVSPSPRAGALVDQCGRVATDLRVSVTDRCNLRCVYCMPAEGLDWLPKPEMLTDDEMVRLVRIAEQLGVTDVRLTGGEPLLRRALPGIVSRFAKLEPRPRLAMTTNGVGLERLAGPLAEAGLDRVNVSLDTVDRETFARLTRRDRIDDVMRGLEASAKAGLTPVKVNAVAMRGINDESAPDLLAWCLDRGYELRFIEQMPLDADHRWTREGMVTQAEILEHLSRRFTLTSDERDRGSAPAQTWLVDGGPGRVGVVASVSAPFCGACDRVRLTADGQLRNCLFARSEDDLRTPMRSGASDEELAALMVQCLAHKKAGHGIDDPSFLQPDRPMSAIGG